ncbi:MAG: hypothetical protein B7Z35_04850 [Hydrogenophilales bacterium 12-61-10]|nr:MAG: hypothetical protein B7Z35_04850 [Hydrogenophilales bacterium 12-61-10]OYX29434.1 MAG: hypothetical protein B7Z03_08880 [Hydrogenophilales bacterium 32-62-9]
MKKASFSPPSMTKILGVTLLVASVLVWAAIYGIGMALMHWPESGGFDHQLTIFSRGLGKIVESSRSPEDMRASIAGANLVLAEFADDGAHADNGAHTEDVAVFNVWRKDGTWIAGSPNVLRVPTGPFMATGFHDAEIGGESYRVYAAWARGHDYRIEVMQTKRGRQADFDSVMLGPASLLTPLLAGFPLLLLPVLWVVKCGLKPLRQLSCELAARPPDDLEPVEMEELVPELQPVVDEINSTLERLRELLRRERDFLADAAHELRTPLAVISAQVDDVLHAKTPEARLEAERGLQAGLGRANRLVGQLLTLARFEAKADKGEPADVADVVRDVLAAHALEAREKSIQLAYRGPDQVPVGCAHHTLETALSNLIGNAIRYGRPGGQVIVRMDVEPSLAFVASVCDDGPGIPREERGRMFDRFWRGSQSSASGSGLGLAIVAAAIRQHNARIHVEDGIDGRGLCVRISVPGPDGTYASS